MGILTREEADVQKIGLMMAGLENHRNGQGQA
jgi:hypothetical protein